jgi:hypothetical protein
LLLFAFFYLRLFFRIVTFQWVTADSNKNFSFARGDPFWLQNARASRPGMMFVGAVAELSAIEFLIGEIIAEVSSLRKKMSIILEFSQPEQPAPSAPSPAGGLSCQMSSSSQQSTPINSLSVCFHPMD